MKEELSKLWEVSPYLGVFVAGFISAAGIMLKIKNATPKEWKSIIDELRKNSKELKKDLLTKDNRIEALHKELEQKDLQISKLQSKLKEHHTEINRLSYNLQKVQETGA